MSSIARTALAWSGSSASSQSAGEPGTTSVLPVWIWSLPENAFTVTRASRARYGPVSRIIITMNPTIAAAVGRLVSLPSCDSGMSSSMITYSIAPAANDMA